MDRRPNLRTVAVALVSLLVPITLLAGTLADVAYKSANPDNIDISTELAYLRQTMVVSVIVFALLLAAVSGLIVKMYRSDGNFTQAKLPLILLVAVVAVLGIVMAVNAYGNSEEDQYLRDQGRPTLDEYFRTLEEQND